MKAGRKAPGKVESYFFRGVLDSANQAADGITRFRFQQELHNVTMTIHDLMHLSEW